MSVWKFNSPESHRVVSPTSRFSRVRESAVGNVQCAHQKRIPVPSRYRESYSVSYSTTKMPLIVIDSRISMRFYFRQKPRSLDRNWVRPGIRYLAIVQFSLSYNHAPCGGSDSYLDTGLKSILTFKATKNAISSSGKTIVARRQGICRITFSQKAWTVRVKTDRRPRISTQLPTSDTCAEGTRHIRLTVNMVT